MSISLSKKDVAWGYIAQFFSLATGLITLPLILNMLSTEEIALNYLMITVGSLVSLFDFGFAPQFGRNITYIFSGSKKLQKEGIEISTESNGINYRLLATMIHTARYVYRRIGLIVLVVMLSFGTLYIAKATNGFSNVENSFIIWIVYSLSTFFNIYFAYYSSLLTGKGLIMESKKASIYTSFIKIILTFLFLYTGLGLLGVSLANLLAPFANRFISYHYFFTKDLKEKISAFIITKNEKIDLFKIIWHNAKKLGLVFLGSYAISKLGIFLAGLYLSPSEVASYGLMLQLVGIISGVASTLFSVYQPKFAELRVRNDNALLIKNFAFTMNIFYLLFIIGTASLIILGPPLLKVIGSNALLPPISIILLYSIIMLLEGNHSNFATFIVTKNSIPFVKPSLIAGAAIGVGSFLSLQYTNLGILGLVLVQGLCQIVYANWKWPHVVCKEFNINFPKFLTMGFKESFNKLKAFI
ncbi:MAG: O-unit flippase-like protein [Tissierellia bacterium]|nr:O-unit flippase-like protein [Tissierellia bacterium]